MGVMSPMGSGHTHVRPYTCIPYTCLESLSCTLITKMMLYVNYISIKKRELQYKNGSPKESQYSK